MLFDADRESCVELLHHENRTEGITLKVDTQELDDVWVMEVTESAAFRDETFQKFHFVSMALVFKENVVYSLASTFQPCAGSRRGSMATAAYYTCLCTCSIIL